jgi:hypothetical protein
MAGEALSILTRTPDRDLCTIEHEVPNEEMLARGERSADQVIGVDGVICCLSRKATIFAGARVKIRSVAGDGGGGLRFDTAPAHGAAADGFFQCAEKNDVHHLAIVKALED